MNVITLKRKNLIPQLEAAHIGAMARLRRAYPSPESQAVLDRVDAVSVELSERMGTCAGKAMMKAERKDPNAKWRRTYNWFQIRLNARLLTINLDELIPTYLHELAHIVANLMMEHQCGHGPAWKMVMGALGEPADRCHDMDVSAFRKVQKKYDYACTECYKDFEMTKIKHTKQQDALSTGSWRYKCKCGGMIKHLP